MLDVQWDVGNRYRLSTIPSEVLSTSPQRGWKWRWRPYAPSFALAVCTGWSLLMLLAAWTWVWRTGGRALEVSRPLVATFAALAALFVTGLWWGGIGGWQADAIDPESVRQAVLQRFAGGWHDKYPPLQYYLLATLYLPTIVANQLGWLTVHSEAAQLAMTITGRLLTVVMAMATALAVAVLTARAIDQRHAWPAALLAGCFLPFAFYAKATNVDLPFVCWFAWSLVCLHALWSSTDVLHHGTIRSAVALGMTAAAAVGTKDQAAALYVLPALLLVWRFGRTRNGWRVLAAGAVSAAAALALIYNVPANPRGLPLHIAFILGPASTGYRMFDPSAAGQWDLLKSTAGQLLFALGVAGTLLIAAGAGSPCYRRARPTFLILIAASVSYYVGFVAYAGYVYDRFLLPVTCVLAPFAAIGLRRLLDARAPLRLLGLGLLAWIVARAAAVDLLMVVDSRTVVERWLRATVQRHEVVAAVNQFGYIPRLYEFKRSWIQPSIAGTLAVGPTYVVINREHAARALPGTAEHAWLAWLESGEGPYDEVLRFKTPVRWTPLALDQRFSDRAQDPFTNLDKINPEIAVFRRRR
jgi:hypothetical protein